MTTELSLLYPVAHLMSRLMPDEMRKAFSIKNL